MPQGIFKYIFGTALITGVVLYFTLFSQQKTDVNMDVTKNRAYIQADEIAAEVARGRAAIGDREHNMKVAKEHEERAKNLQTKLDQKEKDAEALKKKTAQHLKQMEEESNSGVISEAKVAAALENIE